MTAPFALSPLTWADKLVAEPEPERQWIVPGAFERGDRMIITGNEGDGKSTWLRQIAVQVASGIHPFTLEDMPRQRVALVDLENSREQIKGELAKICERAGIQVPGEPWLGVYNWPAGVNLPSNDYEAAMKAELAKYPPDFLIGGPLYKMAERSLSDEDASRGVAAALDRLRETFGFALMLEAHQVNEQVAFDSSAKKWTRDRPMRPFGSSLWRRWPEFGYCLGHDGTLYRWRGDRQARDWPKKLYRDGEVWLWEIDTSLCLVCRQPRPEGKERYCSDRCRETAKKRRQRGSLTAYQKKLLN